MKKLLVLFLFFISFNIYAQEKSMDPKVSIVIPTYNVENYIEQCLESVLNQTHKNLEIIVIDDRSTDNTYQILKKYEKLDNRIKLHRMQQNSGPSKVRNIGIENATGEYLYFMDSDDWIDLNYIEKFLNASQKNDVDLVINYNIILYKNEKDNKFYKSYSKLEPNVYITDDIIKYIYFFPVYICSKFYKTDFIKKTNIKFPEGVIFEDNYFHIVTLIKAEKFYSFRGPSYYYRQRANSITGKNGKNKNPKNLLDFIKMSKITYDFLKKNNLMQKGKIDIKGFEFRLNLSIDKNKFYDETRKFLFDAKNDIELNKVHYTDFDIKFLNKVLKYENYEDYRRAEIILEIILIIILICILVLITLLLFIFLRTMYLIYNDFKKQKFKKT